jgi:hypothetical protein
MSHQGLSAACLPSLRDDHLICELINGGV